MKVAFKARARDSYGRPYWCDDEMNFLRFDVGRVTAPDAETPPGLPLKQWIEQCAEDNTYTHWFFVPPPPVGWEDGAASGRGDLRQAKLAEERLRERARERFTRKRDRTPKSTTAATTDPDSAS